MTGTPAMTTGSEDWHLPSRERVPQPSLLKQPSQETPPDTHLCAVRPPHACTSSSSVSLWDTDRTCHPQHLWGEHGLDQGSILQPSPLPPSQPHLLTEERSSFSSSSLLSELVGSVTDSSPQAVSVADCSTETRGTVRKWNKEQRGATAAMSWAPGGCYLHEAAVQQAPTVASLAWLLNADPASLLRKCFHRDAILGGKRQRAWK